MAFLDAIWNVNISLFSFRARGQNPQRRSSSRRHTSGFEGERASELRKEKLLARTRILERFWKSRRADSNTTRLLIVDVSFNVPSNVMLRSLGHGPMSRQKDDDALQSNLFSFKPR